MRHSGMQQVALKAAAPAMAPVLQVAVRSDLPAVAIFVLIMIQGEAEALGGGTWRAGLGRRRPLRTGILFVAEGLCFTSASRMAIFLYTTPIFARLERLAIIWRGRQRVTGFLSKQECAGDPGPIP